MSDIDKINWPDFDEYLRQGEPEIKERAANWQTAIGLQAVDGLRTSDYLADTARQNIEGKIRIDEVKNLLNSYYQNISDRQPHEEKMAEADKASANIVEILSTRTLDFSTNGLINLHRRIFDGVFKFAGKIRDYDISKKEWILRGQSVSYLNYQDLRAAIDYDIAQEKAFDYKNLTTSDIVEHISRFVAGIWQIHPFGEGNTRTTAVFTIQYLRSIGFDVENDMFAAHSWYFRNALVRANFKSVQYGINYTFSFLEAFFRNLLMGETHELKNRYMLIDCPHEFRENRTSSVQVPYKLEGVTEQVPQTIIDLIHVIGHEKRNTAEIMKAIGLKHRPNFLHSYLEPALSGGYVTRLYPESPRHPRQKYFLTVKGLAVYNQN